MKDRKERMKKSKSVNWDEVRGRMDAAQEALKKGWSPDEVGKKRILKARAEVLAEEPKRREPGEQIEIVEFLLAGERYGVESRYVREVYPLKEYTPVPCTPPFVMGIVNVRGEILSIIDVRKFFDLPGQGLGDLNKVIILSSGDMEFGILADVVAGVRTVAVEALLPSPPTFTGLRHEYLRGIAPDKIAILDAGKMVSDTRIIVNEFV